MLPVAGVACVFIMVFGGYLIRLMTHHSAAPFELIMILGAGVSAFSAPAARARPLLGSFSKVFGEPKWKKQDYRDLLSLLFTVTKTMMKSRA